MSSWFAFGVSVLALFVAGAGLWVSLSTYRRAEGWRQQERDERQPKFTVKAKPIKGLANSTGKDLGTRRIIVTVQNDATEPATLNHADLRAAIDPHSWITVATDTFPERLEPRGGHVTFEVDPQECLRLLESESSGQFYVSVSMDPWTDWASRRVWQLDPFTVDRPPDQQPTNAPT